MIRDIDEARTELKRVYEFFLKEPTPENADWLHAVAWELIDAAEGTDIILVEVNNACIKKNLRG